MSDLVKVRFVLDASEDDENWPPVNIEKVWSESLGSGKYRIDNIPVFAKGIAVDDIIEAREVDGCLQFERVVQHSGNSTYRIIVVGPRATIEDNLSRLRELGCDTEKFSPAWNMVGVNVPPTTDAKKVYEVLRNLEDQGLIGFEEGFFCDSGRDVER